MTGPSSSGFLSCSCDALRVVAAPETLPRRARFEYTATGKEKLADVAKKYGMGSHDLARINRISYDTVLAKGDTIIVYQVKDPSRSKRAEEQWQKTPRARRGKVSGAPAARTASEDKPEDEGPVTSPSQLP